MRADSTVERFKQALTEDNLEGLRELATADPEGFQQALIEARFRYGSPALCAAGSVPTARFLLQSGAELDPVSEWWSPGFYLVKVVDAAVGAFLVEQGVEVTPHAAAALGLVDELQRMITADPQVVHQKGGDGGTPLHFARTVEVARLLVAHGAELDPIDDDHRSTPAQWTIGSAPEVARYLVDQGAAADLFLAAALNDLNLARQLVSRDPACLRHWIGHPPFPGIGHEGTGGTIYQWQLGFNCFPHQVAARLGHTELFDYLWDQSDPPTRFLVACVMGRREEAEAIRAAQPDILSHLTEAECTLLARYCWETNADVETVRLMLDMGFPVDQPEPCHGYSAIHNAAWGGYGELVELLIARGAALDREDPEYHNTPLGFALHCCLVDGRHPEGEYERVVGALIDAGCSWDPASYPTGNDQVDRALRPRLAAHPVGRALLGEGAEVERLLAEGGDRDALGEALLGAAKGGHVELCRRLLEAGAPVVPYPPSNVTALHKAVEGHHLEVVELLLDHGVDVNIPNLVGSTPLHYAGYRGAPKAIFECLLRRGAERALQQQNKFGDTPLDLARSTKQVEAVRILEELGETRDGHHQGG